MKTANCPKFNKQRKKSVRLLNVIVWSTVIAFALEQICLAAPLPSVNSRTLLQQQLNIIPNNFIADPLHLNIPFENVTLKESYKGTNGKLVIHIQDAHSNYSGQMHLAKGLAHLMDEHSINLVLAEGSSVDVTLDEIRKIATPKQWKVAAKRFLMDSVISGEEYLNLTSDRSMTILGIEDQGMYDQSLLAYSEVFQKRKKAMLYLHRIELAVDSIKKRFYSKNLLDYEDVIEADDTNALQAQVDTLFSLSTEAEGVLAEDFVEISQLKKLKQRENRLNFEQVNTEQSRLLLDLKKAGAKKEVSDYLESTKKKSNQITQSLLMQQLLDLGADYSVDTSRYSALNAYRQYLNEFTDIHFDDLLIELEYFEDFIFRSLLESKDAKRIRILDRYIKLLKKAFNLQVSSREFSTFESNEKDFDTKSWEAYLNRLTATAGLAEELIVYKPYIDEATDSLKQFYDLVEKRDDAFMHNIERHMRVQKQNAAFLIAGGYHTRNLTKRLREEGYSYVVITPNVENETDHANYERLLLLPVEKLKQLAISNQNSNTDLVRETRSTLRADHLLGKYGASRFANMYAQPIRENMSVGLMDVHKLIFEVQATRMARIEQSKDRSNPTNISEALEFYGTLKADLIGALDLDRLDEFRILNSQMGALASGPLRGLVDSATDAELLSEANTLISSNAVSAHYLIPGQFGDADKAKIIRRELQGISQVDFSQKMQGWIELVVDEMVTELYPEDLSNQGKWRAQVLADVQPYHWDNYIPKGKTDDKGLNEVVVVQDGKEVSRKQILKGSIAQAAQYVGAAWGSADTASNKVYLHDIDDEFIVRSTLKHELIHYFASQNELKIPAEWEQITFAVDVIERVNQMSKGKRGEYSKQVQELDQYSDEFAEPALQALVERGMQMERDGETGIMIRPTSGDRKANYYSIDRLIIRAMEVYQTQGLDTSGLMHSSYQAQRAAGLLIGGMLIQRMQDDEDLKPLKVLKDVFQNLHDRFADPFENDADTKEIYTNLLGEIQQFVASNAGLANASSVELREKESGIWSYEVTPEGKHILYYVPSDLHPRFYDGDDADDKAGQMKIARLRGLGQTFLAMAKKNTTAITEVKEKLPAQITGHPGFDALWDTFMIAQIAKEGLREAQAKKDEALEEQYQGLGGWMKALFEDRYESDVSIEDADEEKKRENYLSMQQDILGSLPYHLQYLDSLLYRFYNYDSDFDDFSIGADDPRVKSPRVAEAIVETVGSKINSDDSRPGWAKALLSESGMSSEEMEQALGLIWPAYQALYDKALEEEKQRLAILRKLKEEQQKAQQTGQKSQDPAQAQQQLQEQDFDQMWDSLPDDVKQDIEKAAQKEMQAQSQEFGCCSNPSPADDVSSEESQQAGSPSQGSSQSGQGQASSPDQVKDLLDQIQKDIEQLGQELDALENQGIEGLGRDLNQLKPADAGAGKQGDDNQQAAELSQGVDQAQVKNQELLEEAREIEAQINANNQKLNEIADNLLSPEQATQAQEIAEQLGQKAKDLKEKLEKVQEHLNNLKNASDGIKDANSQKDSDGAGEQIQQAQQELDAAKKDLGQPSDGTDQAADIAKQLQKDIEHIKNAIDADQKEIDKPTSDPSSSADTDQEQASNEPSSDATTSSSQADTQEGLSTAESGANDGAEQADFPTLPKEIDMKGDLASLSDQMGSGVGSSGASGSQLQQSDAELAAEIESSAERLAEEIFGLNEQQRRELQNYLDAVVEFPNSEMTLDDLIEVLTQLFDVLAMRVKGMKLNSLFEDGAEIIDPLGLIVGEDAYGRWSKADPLDGKFVVLIDDSGSMQDRLYKQHTRSEVAANAALAFVKTLYNHNDLRNKLNMPNPLEFMVAKFGNDTKTILDSQIKKASSEESMYRMMKEITGSYGGTDILRALKKYAKQLEADVPNKQDLRTIVVITDFDVSPDSVKPIADFVAQKMKEGMPIIFLPIGTDFSGNSLYKKSKALFEGLSDHIIDPEPYGQMPVNLMKAIFGTMGDFPGGDQALELAIDRLGARMAQNLTVVRDQNPITGYQNFYLGKDQLGSEWLIYEDDEVTHRWLRAVGLPALVPNTQVPTKGVPENEKKILEILIAALPPDEMRTTQISPDGRFTIRLGHGNSIKVVENKIEQKATGEFVNKEKKHSFKFLKELPQQSRVKKSKGVYSNEENVFEWSLVDGTLKLKNTDQDALEVEGWSNSSIDNRQNMDEWSFYEAESDLALAYHSDTRRVIFLKRETNKWVISEDLFIGESKRQTAWSRHYVELVGRTGLGKDEILLAAMTLIGWPILEINAHGDLTSKELVQYVKSMEVAGTTNFKPSIFAQIMHYGGAIVVREAHKLDQETFNAFKVYISSTTHLWPVQEEHNGELKIVMKTLPNHPTTRLFTSVNTIDPGIDGMDTRNNPPMQERKISIPFYWLPIEQEVAVHLYYAKKQLLKSFSGSKKKREEILGNLEKDIKKLVLIAMQKRFTFAGYERDQRNALLAFPSLQNPNVRAAEMGSSRRKIAKLDKTLREIFERGQRNGVGVLLKRAPSPRVLAAIVKHFVAYPKDLTYRSFSTIKHYYNFAAERDPSNTYDKHITVFEQFRSDMQKDIKPLDLSEKSFEVTKDAEGLPILTITPPNGDYWDPIVIPIHPEASIALHPKHQLPIKLRYWIKSEQNALKFYRWAQNHSLGRVTLNAGKPGAGKSFLAEAIQDLVNPPGEDRVDITKETLVSELAWSRELNGFKLEYRPGIVVQAMNDNGHGKVLVISEAAQGRPGVLAVMGELFARGILAHPTDKDGVAKIARGAGFILDMNIDGSGLIEIPDDILDRVVVMEFETLGPEDMAEYLKEVSERMIVTGENIKVNPTLILGSPKMKGDKPLTVQFKFKNSTRTEIKYTGIIGVVQTLNLWRQEGRKGALNRDVSYRILERFLISLTLNYGHKLASTLDKYPQKALYTLFAETYGLEGKDDVTDAMRETIIEAFVENDLWNDDVDVLANDGVNKFLNQESVLVQNLDALTETDIKDKQLTALINNLQTSTIAQPSLQTLKSIRERIFGQDFLDEAQWKKIKFEEKLKRMDAVRQVYHLLDLLIKKRSPGNNEGQQAYDEKTIVQMQALMDELVVQPKGKNDQAKTRIEELHWPEEIFTQYTTFANMSEEWKGLVDNELVFNLEHQPLVESMALLYIGNKIVPATKDQGNGVDREAYKNSIVKLIEVRTQEAASRLSQNLELVATEPSGSRMAIRDDESERIRMALNALGGMVGSSALQGAVNSLEAADENRKLEIQELEQQIKTLKDQLAQQEQNKSTYLGPEETIFLRVNERGYLPTKINGDVISLVRDGSILHIKVKSDNSGIATQDKYKKSFEKYDLSTGELIVSERDVQDSGADWVLRRPEFFYHDQIFLDDNGVLYAAGFNYDNKAGESGAFLEVVAINSQTNEIMEDIFDNGIVRLKVGAEIKNYNSILSLSKNGDLLQVFINPTDENSFYQMISINPDGSIDNSISIGSATGKPLNLLDPIAHTSHGDGSMAFVIDRFKGIVAINLNTGQIERSLLDDGYLKVEPKEMDPRSLASDGEVLYITDGITLKAFDIQSGEPTDQRFGGQNSIAAPFMGMAAPLNQAMYYSNGLLLASDSKGLLFALDVKTGAVESIASADSKAKFIDARFTRLSEDIVLIHGLMPSSGDRAYSASGILVYDTQERELVTNDQNISISFSTEPIPEEIRNAIRDLKSQIGQAIMRLEQIQSRMTTDDELSRIKAALEGMQAVAGSNVELDTALLTIALKQAEASAEQKREAEEVDSLQREEERIESLIAEIIKQNPNLAAGGGLITLRVNDKGFLDFGLKGSVYAIARYGEWLYIKFDKNWGRYGIYNMATGELKIEGRRYIDDRKDLLVASKDFYSYRNIFVDDDGIMYAVDFRPDSKKGGWGMNLSILAIDTQTGKVAEHLLNKGHFEKLVSTSDSNTFQRIVVIEKNGDNLQVILNSDDFNLNPTLISIRPDGTVDEARSIETDETSLESERILSKPQGYARYGDSPTAFVLDEHRHVAAINMDTGKLETSLLKDGYAPKRDGYSDYTRAIATDDEVVYIADKNVLRAVDVQTGKVAINRFNGVGFIENRLFDNTKAMHFANGFLYHLDENGMVRTFDPQTGQLEILNEDSHASMSDAKFHVLNEDILFVYGQIGAYASGSVSVEEAAAPRILVIDTQEHRILKENKKTFITGTAQDVPQSVIDEFNELVGKKNELTQKISSLAPRMAAQDAAKKVTPGELAEYLKAIAEDANLAPGVGKSLLNFASEQEAIIAAEAAASQTAKELVVVAPEEVLVQTFSDNVKTKLKGKKGKNDIVFTEDTLQEFNADLEALTENLTRDELFKLSSAFTQNGVAGNAQSRPLVQLSFSDSVNSDEGVSIINQTEVGSDFVLNLGIGRDIPVDSKALLKLIIEFMRKYVKSTREDQLNTQLHISIFLGWQKDKLGIKGWSSVKKWWPARMTLTHARDYSELSEGQLRLFTILNTVFPKTTSESLAKTAAAFPERGVRIVSAAQILQSLSEPDPAKRTLELEMPVLALDKSGEVVLDKRGNPTYVLDENGNAITKVQSVLIANNVAPILPENLLPQDLRANIHNRGPNIPSADELIKDADWANSLTETFSDHAEVRFSGAYLYSIPYAKYWKKAGVDPLTEEAVLSEVQEPAFMLVLNAGQARKGKLVLTPFGGGAGTSKAFLDFLVTLNVKEESLEAIQKTIAKIGALNDDEIPEIIRRLKLEGELDLRFKIATKELPTLLAALFSRENSQVETLSGRELIEEMGAEGTFLNARELKELILDENRSFEQLVYTKDEGLQKNPDALKARVFESIEAKWALNPQLDATELRKQLETVYALSFKYHQDADNWTRDDGRVYMFHMLEMLRYYTDILDLSDANTVFAILLHDVVEDTQILAAEGKASIEELLLSEGFGAPASTEISEIVGLLTEDTGYRIHEALTLNAEQTVADRQWLGTHTQYASYQAFSGLEHTGRDATKVKKWDDIQHREETSDADVYSQVAHDKATLIAAIDYGHNLLTNLSSASMKYRSKSIVEVQRVWEFLDGSLLDPRLDNEIRSGLDQELQRIQRSLFRQDNWIAAIRSIQSQINATQDRMDADVNDTNATELMQKLQVNKQEIIELMIQIRQLNVQNESAFALYDAKLIEETFGEIQRLTASLEEIAYRDSEAAGVRMTALQQLLKQPIHLANFYAIAPFYKVLQSTSAFTSSQKQKWVELFQTDPLFQDVLSQVFKQTTDDYIHFEGAEGEVLTFGRRIAESQPTLVLNGQNLPLSRNDFFESSGLRSSGISPAKVGDDKRFVRSSQRQLGGLSQTNARQIASLLNRRLIGKLWKKQSPAQIWMPSDIVFDEQLLRLHQNFVNKAKKSGYILNYAYDRADLKPGVPTASVVDAQALKNGSYTIQPNTTAIIAIDSGQDAFMPLLPEMFLLGLLNIGPTASDRIRFIDDFSLLMRSLGIEGIELSELSEFQNYSGTERAKTLVITYSIPRGLTPEAALAHAQLVAAAISWAA